MNMRDWDFIGRRPRHQAAVAEAVQVDVERGDDAPTSTVAAELVDFSRHGARVRAEAALAQDELVAIRLRQPTTGLDVALPGAVRWRSQEASGHWLYGCQFKEEVPLEMLGELFLCGILSARPPASSG